MSDSFVIDPGLLDLFREEVRGNIQMLNEGLVALEESPDDLRRIEPLMRAAHSVKGAARTLGIDPAVGVAHSLEECLVLAQNGRLVLNSAGVDVLLQAVDTLGQMGEAVGPGFSVWHAEHGDDVARLLERLQAVARGTPLAATEVQTRPTPAVEGPEEEPSAEVKSNREEAAAGPAEDDESRRPLLELFRTELATHGWTLREGLDRLETEPAAGAALDPLLRAARWARSSCHIVHLAAAARLAQAVEDRLQVVQGGRQPASGEDLATLRRAADLLPALGEAAAGTEFRAWLAEHQSEMDALVEQLKPATIPHKPDGREGEAPAEPRGTGVALGSAGASPSRPSGLYESAPGETRVRQDVPAPDLVLAHPPVPREPPARVRPVERAPTPVRSVPAPDREAEQVVRVTAQSLTRLMGLAGEALVQARWLQPFTQLLVRLKRRQARLMETLDELGQSLPPGLLAEVREGMAACHTELDDRIGEFEDHAREADNLNSRLYHEVIASRMRPFGDGTGAFPRLVRDLARQLGKKVRFEVVGETTEVDRDILEKLEAPLSHLVRNALDHGLETPEERAAAGKPETGSLRLEARHNAGMLSIQVRDDGRGIAPERIRRKVIDRKLTSPEMAADLRDDELLEFLFLPGFSTAEQVTDVSGRGVGLDVVQSMVRVVGGTVRINSQPGRGTTFHLQLPVTLSVIRAVLTEIADEPYAFPHNRINRLLRLPRADLGSLQDRQFFEVDGRNVGVVLARQLFELGGEPPLTPNPSPPRGEGRKLHPSPLGGEGRKLHPSPLGGEGLGVRGDDLFVVLFGEPGQEHGLVVDRFVGEQDLVVRPLDSRLGKVPNISAAAILEDGAPVLIVDVDDLGRSIHKLLQGGRLLRTDRGAGQPERARRVLVVDDSITVREVQRQLLQSRGYEVEVAVDGMDGWHMVRRGGFDLVVSDVDMPRLDGLGLVRLIKADPELLSTPVVIVSYKDQEEHRLAGLEAGANYYLTKSSFHDATFLEAVEELIGGPGR